MARFGVCGLNIPRKRGEPGRYFYLFDSERSGNRLGSMRKGLEFYGSRRFRISMRHFKNLGSHFGDGSLQFSRRWRGNGSRDFRGSRIREQERAELFLKSGSLLLVFLGRRTGSRQSLCLCGLGRSNLRFWGWLLRDDGCRNDFLRKRNYRRDRRWNLGRGHDARNRYGRRRVHCRNVGGRSNNGLALCKDPRDRRRRSHWLHGRGSRWSDLRRSRRWHAGRYRGKLWRSGSGRSNRPWRRRYCGSWCGAIGWEAHAPESSRGLREFQFNVTGHGAIVFGFDDLADHFLLGFFVGEENQLAWGNRRGETNDGTLTKNEHGFGSFRKRFAFVGASHRARAVDGDRDFQRYRLRTRRRNFR